jgi:hypothetical protein
MSISGFRNWIDVGLSFGRTFFPSTVIESAWISTSIIARALYSDRTIRIFGGIAFLSFGFYKQYQASHFSGFCKSYYLNGSFYQGNYLNGQFHGKGKLIFADGEYYEGDFVNGSFHGQGKKVQVSGNVYEGNFVNGYFRGDISHLGDRLFFDLVCRRSKTGALVSYSLGIMSDYLQKKGYKTAGDALSEALRLSLISSNELKKESEKIHNALNKGLSQLLAYGFEEHGMGLNLVPDLFKGFVLCEVFNSGEGLKKYHEKHETDFRKYKTMLQIRVPIKSLTPDKIRVFFSRITLKNAEEAYEAILDLPGAEIIPSDLIPWQTKQKAGKCSFRWILAYLKNKIPEKEYKQMLSELRLDCEAAYRSKNPHEDFGLDQ